MTTTEEPHTSELLSLTYVSSAVPPISETELEGLLAVSRERNGRADVTGILLYSDGNVMQVLEGPPAAVEETFSRVFLDERHQGVIVILRRATTERAFPDWSMGYRRFAPGTAPAGFSSYLSLPTHSTPEEVHGTVGKLLQQFKSTAR